MIKRPLYLNELVSYIDKPFIKVIAGIRRAGKSSLLEQVYDELISRHTPASQIALINFGSIDYANIRTKADFVTLSKTLLNQGVRYFLFDEVQNVENWDEVISALYAEKNTDIFITGSNSKLLSSELSTFFTGRYVDFKINTLNFEEAMVIERVPRYDIRGKELLKTQEKYYLSDIGLLYAINGRSNTYLSGVLENTIYHELVSHDYKVYIGKNDDKEIDFIAEKDHSKMYLQVSAHLSDQQTIEREFSALRNISDNYPKYILTLDQDFLHTDSGIEAKYLPEFILSL